MKGGILLCCWLLGVGMAAGATGSSEAALGFLEDLKADEKGVEACLADSLLSVHCGDAKREAIQARLERLGESLRRGEMELQFLDEKVDGDSAGVLVAALGGLNPMDVEVVALGARQSGGGWKVAPVPGSFENAVDGFDPEVRRRLVVLEDWMMLERGRQSQVLHEAGEGRLRERMKAAVPEKLLQEGSAVDVLEGFLDACARRDLAGVLVFVTAGMDSEGAEKLRNIVSAGLQGLDRNVAWALLTGPGVAGVLMESDGEREVLALFYDAAGNGAVRAIEFDVVRVGDLWQVMMPAQLRGGPIDVRRSREWVASGELQRKFPRVFEDHWTAFRGESMEEATRSVVQILTKGRLSDLFRWSCRIEGMEDIEKMVVYSEAAGLWGRFRNAEDVMEGKLVGVMEEGTAGLIVMHLVSASRITAPELVPIQLMRGADGWGLAPGVTGRGFLGRLSAEDAQTQRNMMVRFLDEKEEWQKKAAAGFLADFDEVGPDGVLSVTPAETREAVEAFRRDLRQRRMKSAYRRCGLVNRSEGALEALNALRYEARGVQDGVAEKDQEMLVRVEGTWGMVSMRVQSGMGHEPDYPMYLVRKTGDGMRVMVDAGLRYVTNPGRRILNDAVWAHLAAHLDPADEAVVRKLFELHHKSSEKDYKEWEKNSK